jgi:anti-sigma factor RsiW
MSEISERDRFERDHRWVPDQMSAYLDQDLPAGALARIEHHLGECSECRKLLASLKRMIDRLATLAAPRGAPEPSEIAADVRVRLNQPPGS